MRILLLTKRRYTNRDLIGDRFGRLYHLPAHWAQSAQVRVACIDYRRGGHEVASMPGFTAESRSLRSTPIQAVSATMLAARDFEPDVVVATSDIVYGLLGLRIARRCNARLVLDLYDDYRNFAYNRFSGLALALGPVCRRADLVLCASEPIGLLARKWGARQTLVVPNGYDPAVFHPGRDLARRAQLGIGNEDVLLVYPGAVVDHVDTQLVVDALDQLNGSGIAARALFIGAGSAQVASRSRHLYALPETSQQEVAGWLRAADIGIAPYRRTGQTEVSAPCKIAEFLACGLPVVAANVSDTASFAPHGVRVHEPGDVAGFCDAVRRQVASPPSRPVPGWTWDELGAASLDAIRECLQKKDLA